MFCQYRGCDAVLPEEATARRRFCRSTHRVAEHRACREDFRRESFELLRLGSRLRGAGCTDRALLDDIDARCLELIRRAGPRDPKPPVDV